MEKKPRRTKISIFSFLPKSTSFSFSSYPFSPGHDRRQENQSKLKANAGRGFSGPIVSIIPAEARRKHRNGSFDDQEPTSPKVSCIGQIKQKKKILKAHCKTPAKDEHVKKKVPFKISRIFHGGRRESRSNSGIAPASAPPPSIGQMKRFTSGRSALADFDWRVPGGGSVSSHRGYYSDEDQRGVSDDEDDDDDDFGVAYSAPLGVVGGGVALEPRKDVNIWKRRTIDPPKPLQLKVKDMDKHST